MSLIIQKPHIPVNYRARVRVRVSRHLRSHVCCVMRARTIHSLARDYVCRVMRARTIHLPVRDHVYGVTRACTIHAGVNSQGFGLAKIDRLVGFRFGTALLVICMMGNLVFRVIKK